MTGNFSMMRVWIGPAFTLATLLGCAVGPRYELPAPLDGAQGPLVSLTPGRQ